jgi:hypothetical protein
MKSKLSLAVGFALARAAFAEQQPTEDLSAQDQTQERAVNLPYSQSVHNPLSIANEDDIHGKPVVDLQGNKVGDADSIWIQPVTQEKVITVDLQGVVGDNNKEIAVPLSAFSLTADGQALQLGYTKEQLQSRPDFDASDYVENEDAEEAE